MNAGHVIDAKQVVDYFCSEQSRIDGHAFNSTIGTAQDRGWENYLKRLLYQQDTANLLAVLEAAMRKHGLPLPNLCFVMTDVDHQRERVYLAFDDAQLYVCRETEALQRLDKSMTLQTL